MGGPKAWRESQQRQQEFLAQFNEEPPPQVNSDDEDAGDGEKRDLYAEYGVEPETENEKEARGGNDIADDDPEDVGLFAFFWLQLLDVRGYGLTFRRSSPWLRCYGR